MHIVIDIPEQMYLNAKANTLCGGDIIVKAIKNGTPLTKIRDKITTEADYEDEYDDQDIAKGLYKAVDIIDKYKAESER